VSVHLPNIAPDVRDQIVNLMKRPEGTLTFRYTFEGLFDRSLGRGILLQIVTGGYLFRLTRDEDLNLTFTQAAPGTGTRIATVALEPLRDCASINVAITWSPDDIALHVLDPRNPTRMLTAHGARSPRLFQVGVGGMIAEIGDVGVEGIETYAYVDGKTVIQPPALEAWRATLKAVEVLLSGSSTEGYMYEVVTANLSISILVTGYETYCKRRFLELEQEGMNPDLAALFSVVLVREERQKREQGEALQIEQDAAAQGVSLIQHLSDLRRLDFQDFARCKRLYNKAYHIKFGEDLDQSNQILEEVQKFIQARHRIVHVTPLSPLIFEPGKMEDEAMIARVQRATRAFDTFINGLHAATLRLRPIE
jgi:hypothetical protein